MAWSTETIGGVETIVGDVGDPLGLHIVITFDPDEVVPDFRGHTWILQIREHVLSVLTAEVPLAEDGDQTTVDTIDLLFELEDTTVLVGGMCYKWGLKAVDGPNAPWTAIGVGELKPRDVVPREET